MQGKLRNQKVEVTIESECAHCARPIKIELDSDLNLRVDDKDCDPVIFVPDVNFFKLDDDSIIDSF